MNSKAKSGKKLRRVIIATVTVVLIAVITVTGVLTDGFRNFGKAPEPGVTLEHGDRRERRQRGNADEREDRKRGLCGVRDIAYGGERTASDCNRGAGRCDGQVCGLEHSVRKSDVGMGER